MTLRDVLIVLAIIAVGVAVFFFWQRRHTSEIADKPATMAVTTEAPATVPAPAAAPEAPKPA